MKITLTKSGKNVRISFDPTETTQPDLLEDSSNVEVSYQNLNNTVSVQVTGNNYFTTSDITASNQLYMDSGSGPVLINSKALFLANYPLVFPNGGGGPVTTPNIDQVLAQGGSLTANRLIDVDSYFIELFSTTYPAEGLIFNLGGGSEFGFKTGSKLKYSQNVISTIDGTQTNAFGFNTNNSTNVFRAGDVNLTNNGVLLNIDDTNNLIFFAKGGGPEGLNFDLGNKVYDFGNQSSNGNKIRIEDVNNEIKVLGNQTTGFVGIEANVLKFTGANLESNTSSGASGQHLVIELNGVTYHIELRNP